LLLNIPGKYITNHGSCNCTWSGSHNKSKRYASSEPAFPLNVIKWVKFLKRTKTLGQPVVLANFGAQLYAQVDDEATGSMEDLLNDYPADTRNAWTVLDKRLLRRCMEIVPKEENVTFQFGKNEKTPPRILADGLLILLMPMHSPDEPELVKPQKSGAIPMYLPQIQETVPA
jgi:hypothetical protein